MMRPSSSNFVVAHHGLMNGPNASTAARASAWPSTPSAARSTMAAPNARPSQSRVEAVGHLAHQESHYVPQALRCHGQVTLYAFLVCLSASVDCECDSVPETGLFAIR